MQTHTLETKDSNQAYMILLNIKAVVPNTDGVAPTTHLFEDDI